MTFKIFTPFLKGFRLTLVGHLPGRDLGGGKLTEQAWISYVHDKFNQGELSREEMREALNPPKFEDIPIPKTTTAATRLLWDLEALTELMSPDNLPKVIVCARKVFTILYGFGDTSGRGFGSTVLGLEGIRYRIGTWEADVDGESSNWREFEKIVCALEEVAKAGSLIGALVYLFTGLFTGLFTDNSTVEAALYKGNSTSRRLFHLVVRLRKLELAQGGKFVVSHCLGERMKAQGTDGVSRGQLKEGVTTGADMLSFIPTNEDALKRAAPLKS